VRAGFGGMAENSQATCGGSGASASEPETMTIGILLPAERSASTHAHPVEVRHGAVRYHEVEFFLREPLQPGGAVARGFDLVALEIQDERVKFSHSCIVLHDQQSRAR